MSVSKIPLGVFNKLGDRIISGSSLFLSTLSDVHDLALQNERLSLKVKQLEAENAQLKELKKENEVLKKEIGFVKENKEAKLIPSYVIGRTPDLRYLILDQGSRKGIKKGQAVISEGLLVGKIAEVNPLTSKVLLITNPISAVPAITQESRVSGLVKGEIGYGLIMEDLPKETPLVPGENVVTSAIGGDYPKGLLIGKIKETISSPADIFQSASLTPLLNFEKVELVFIVKTD